MLLNYRKSLALLICAFLEVVFFVACFGISGTLLVWPIILLICIIGVCITYIRGLKVGLVFCILITCAIFLGKSTPRLETKTVESTGEFSSLALDFKALFTSFSVTGDSSNLLEMSYYDSAERYSIVEAISDDRSKKLVTVHPQFSQILRSGKENIELKVARIPTELSVIVQFSQGIIDLRSVEILDFRLKAASGDITIYLPEKCSTCTLWYEAWSTKTVLKIPKDAGIQFKSEHPSVGVKLPGKDFSNESVVQSDNFLSASRQYFIDIKGSTGSIVVEEYTVE